MTTAESALWEALRATGLGARARRQHIVLGWIVDFYFPSARLAVEVDGDAHDAQVDEDARRAAALGARGITVIRVTNDEVLARIDEVLVRIDEVLSSALRARHVEAVDHPGRR